MTQLSKADLNADIVNNIYTNKQRLIKGNTIRQRLLNLKDSTLNSLEDLNMPSGYLGISSEGRIDTSFVSAATPLGKFLRDDGSWQTVSPLPTQTDNAGKALFTNGNSAEWTAISAEYINNVFGYTPLSPSLTAGSVLVGNGSNIAAQVALTLNSSAGSFSLSSAGALTMPDASAGTRGLLSNTDWTTFNNKQANLGFTPINKAGDTMTGTLTLNSNAVNPMEAVTYQQLQAWQVGLWDDRGSFDASANLFPGTGGSGIAGAVLKGDIWTISVVGVLGGTPVNAGDTVRALTDGPGQISNKWSIAEGNLGYTPLSTTLPSGQIYVGNASNIAAAAILKLNGSAGSFSLSNAGILTMPNADGTNRGLLSAEDWLVFSNKQAAIGYTPLANTLSNGRIFIGNGSNIATATAIFLSAASGSFSLSPDGTLTFPNADVATRGLLTASDWAVFKNKQDALGFTPMGNTLSKGKIFIGNDANIATGNGLFLSASAGSFGLAIDGTLTMPNADTVTRGLLSASDWTAFNSKQAALGYTPLANTLSNGRIFIGNGSNIATATGIFLSAAGGSFSLSSDGSLTFPNADAATRGLLTASDWSAFKNKQDALGFTPMTSTLAKGKIFIGNDANIAAANTLSLSEAGGSFGLTTGGSLTIPNASAGTRGLITAEDWNSFNSRAGKAGSISAGQLATWYDGNTVTGNPYVSMSGNSLVVSGQIVSGNNIYSQPVSIQSVAGSAEVDCRLSNSFSFKLDGDTSFSLYNMAEGMTVVIDISQNEAYTCNVSFSGSYETIKWKDGTAPAMTATPEKTDVFTFIKTNNIIYGFFTQNF